MADCLVSFGSNLGDGRAAFSIVQGTLRNHPRIHQVSASSLIKTRPIGGDPAQAAYLNGAIRFQTDLPPVEVFRLLRSAESSLGRVRDRRWGPRTVDLDLLLLDRQVGQWEVDSNWLLEIPHPRMTFRRFVLTPASQIAADMFHEEAQMTIAELVRHLDEKPNIVAVFDDAERVGEMLQHSARATECLRDEQDQSAGHRVEILSSPQPENFSAQGCNFGVVPTASSAHWSQIRHQCKLIVFWKESIENRESWLTEAVRTFSGPRLALGHDALREAGEEIVAALASIVANSVDA